MSSQPLHPASPSTAAVFPPVDTELIKDLGHIGIDAIAGCRPEDVQASYVDQQRRILDAIDGTTCILKGVQDFNKKSWTVRYPTFKDSPPPSPNDRPSPRRALTFADDPTRETTVVIGLPNRGPLKRSMTMATVPEDTKDGESEAEALESEEGLIPTDFNILRLDLKIGPHGSSTSAGSLVSQLEKASIANLVDQRINHSLSHIEKLRQRVEDKSSKVLVTGDLNAGKSTFVNALLGKQLMPVDQQPCTTMFCEVHDAAENEGKEEVHIVNEGVKYSLNDSSTFTRAEVSELESIVSESDAKRVCILYAKDARMPSHSLVNNGVVDIALIDAPGLNRDSLKTTELFARQEEIDVVVFVVSAENHFTLSAKEFLWTASSEKAFVFIVVNKYDQIRDKAKCKRMVLEQIQALSPQTWAHAEELVHFVDSNSALARTAFPTAEPPKSSVPAESFETLESSLRSFVLVKRARSKLHPVTTYLTNILADIDLLANANAIVAQSERDQAQTDLTRARPILEAMVQCRDTLQEALENEEDTSAQEACNRATAVLEQALERVGKGEMGVNSQLLARTVATEARVVPTLPPYPGIWSAWDYAGQVRKALLASLDLAVAIAEDEARHLASGAISQVHDMGDKYLPAGVERSRRVFVPSAMFSSRRNGKQRQTVVAGGAYGLGIGLGQRQDLLEVTFQDLFDIHHRVLSHFGGEGKQLDDDEGTSALGIMSLGLGAMTMVGGKVVGIRGLLDVIIRITDIFSNEKSRKTVLPVVAAIAAGLGGYLVWDLPHAIPRTVGRQIKASLVQITPADNQFSSALVTPQPTFTAHHAQRIQRETRKVVRLASWDLKERFRAAYEDCQKDVKGAEELEARAGRAMAWFTEVVERTHAVREKGEFATVG